MRRPIDPRWLVVRSVDFGTATPAMTRTRDRAHARALIVASNAINYAARSDLLAPLTFELAAIDSWNEPQAIDFIEHALRTSMAASAEGAIAELIEEKSAHGAARHIFNKMTVALVRAGKVKSAKPVAPDHEVAS